MPKPGDVFYHSQFKYSNGTFGKKLLIILNKSDFATNCLVLKTTSQNKRYQGVTKGCNPGKRVFYIPAYWQNFDKDTYVQLPQIFSIPTSQFIKQGMQNILAYKFTLTADCLRLLLTCIRKYFRKDISEQNWNLIFK